MDRLNSTHLKVIQQEREQFLERRYQLYMASQARREKHLQSQGSARVLLRVSSIGLLLMLVLYFLVR